MLDEAVVSFTGVIAVGAGVSGTVTLYWCLTLAAGVTATAVAAWRPSAGSALPVGSVANFRCASPADRYY